MTTNQHKDYAIIGILPGETIENMQNNDEYDALCDTHDVKGLSFGDYIVAEYSGFNPHDAKELAESDGIVVLSVTELKRVEE